MPEEYCPKCRKLVDTYTTTDAREEHLITIPVKVPWVTYFCHTCRLSIRSEKQKQKTAAVSQKP